MQDMLNSLPGLALWAFPVIVILAAIVVDRVSHALFELALRRWHFIRQVWRHGLLAAAEAPVRALVWLAALVVIKHHFTPLGTHLIVARMYPQLVGVLVILIVAWFLLRLVNRVRANYMARAASRNDPIDPTAVDAISKLSWAAITVFAALSVLQQLGVSLAGLLAFGGAAGIAVGFAAQTLVANLLGGLTIYASRIFKIGETIIMPGSSVVGEVQHIGWRSTRLLGWDGKPTYVPNSLFNTSNVTNHSRLVRRTISENILLRYRDFGKVPGIVRDANKMLEGREDLCYFMFRFYRFAERALQLHLYAWVQLPDQPGYLPYAEYMRVQEELLLAIAGIAQDHGCELIVPEANLYLQQGAVLQGPDPLAGTGPGFAADPRA